MKKPTFDILRARHDTPGCRNVIHFNNAGASLIPQPVLDTVIDYLKLEASIGGYEAASQSLDKIEKVYDGAAALIGTASVSKKAFAALMDEKVTAEGNPIGKTHDQQFRKEGEDDLLSHASASGKKMMLAQNGSVRRQNRRVARRTSRRTARRVSERND